MPSKRIAYLYSRFPVVSQTFCDSEMLELEAKGTELVIGSLNPPRNDFRHERHAQLKAEVIYPPPSPILRAYHERAREQVTWAANVEPLVVRHEKTYGVGFKPETRARNAAFFGEAFAKRGVDHIHVHFANRATITALFIKHYAGIPFSFTAHAQDFMVDLGDDDLLAELCHEAEFVVAVSDWSRDLLAKTCPGIEDKLHRIYNGIQLTDFPQALPETEGPLRIVSIGRLIDFKGFQNLIAACAKLKEWGEAIECTIIGDGPLRDDLVRQRDQAGLTEEILFAGVRTQEEVKRTLAESNVFALPCIVDSKGASDILPTVIMEAMACSLPVVSTRLVGVPEMVEHEKTGLLTEPGDVEGLALALQKLRWDPGLRRHLGEEGYKLAESRFQRKNTTGELLKLFESTEPGEIRANPVPPKVLYVIDIWPTPEDEFLTQELEFIHTRCHEIQVLACQCVPKLDAKARRTNYLGVIEFLPDPMVLEADWKHHGELVERIWELRAEVDGDVAPERYFLEARRAIHLARLMRKRGIRRVHGARSTTALTAWLTAKLMGKDARFSYAAEGGGLHDAKLLDRLEEDAVVVSRSDQKDLLELGAQDSHEWKMGPAKLNLGRGPGKREAIYEAWTQRLLA